VDTQKEVVKEEKREGTDNVPYGKIIYMPVVQNHLFDKHPYKHPTIGSMDDLNSAKARRLHPLQPPLLQP